MVRDDLLTKLGLMKNSDPAQFRIYMNKLKIENPTLFEKYKVIFKFEDDGSGVLDIGEEPLELSLYDEVPKDSKLLIYVLFGVSIIIIIAILYFVIT